MRKNPCWGHRLWCRLLIPTSAPQDCWLRPAGRAGTQQPAVHERCVRSDWETQIRIFPSQTQQHIQHCQLAGRHPWLCPQQANGATQRSHFLMCKSKKRSILSSINLLIDWFSQPISHIFSQLQRQNNAKLPCSLKFSLIQQRNWREIISFDNSWFPFPGIPPNAWRISHSRNSLTLHSIQL